MSKKIKKVRLKNKEINDDYYDLKPETKKYAEETRQKFLEFLAADIEEGNIEIANPILVGEIKKNCW